MEEKTKIPRPGPERLIPVTRGKTDDANIINRRRLERMMVEKSVIAALFSTTKAGDCRAWSNLNNQCSSRC